MARKLLFVLLMSVIVWPSVPAQSGEAAPEKPTPHYKQKYDFSEDWFTHNIPVWDKAFDGYRGKPDVNYLEIGAFEGRSLIWMLENILTHSTARATAVDIFPGDLKRRFLSNMKVSGAPGKVTTITGSSTVELRNLPLESFDIIYIDGSHLANNVMSDGVLSWELLKPGGLLVFDDYGWTHEWPEELLPRIAIDSFISAYRAYMKVLYRDYQLIIRKGTGPVCPSGYDDRCSRIGQYVYFWEKEELRQGDGGKLVELSGREREIIKQLLKSKKFGETEIEVDSRMLMDKDFRSLKERLNLDL